MPKFEGDWDVYNKSIRAVLNDLAVSLVMAEPIEIHHIPYPAHPQLNDIGWPSFCHGKEQCWGRSSCPREYSCTE
jgi:hypothetical protein